MRAQDCLEPGLLLMKWVFPVKKIYLVKGNVFVRKKYDRHETIGEIVIPVRFWRGGPRLPAPKPLRSLSSPPHLRLQILDNVVSRFIDNRDFVGNKIRRLVVNLIPMSG